MINNIPNNGLTMRLLKGKFGVCRLDSTDLIPDWGQRGGFISITRTLDELSVVCNEECIPNNIKCEKDWRILKVEGPLNFSLIGILSSISTVLSRNRISIFAISTYDTDYILVKSKDINNAIEALVNEGYGIVEER